MNRSVSATLVSLGLVTLAACGSAGGTSAATQPSPSPSARVRNGASGELVKITGTELILSSTAGDATVDYTAATTFQRTSTGTLGDIAAGKCLVAAGQKDATGALVVANVRLSTKVDGACAVPGGGPGAFPGRNRPSPSPGASPRPNFTAVAGEVTAVSGTGVQVRDAAGTVQAITVPTTVTVSKSAAASATDLALHQCIQAQGQRDGAGTVTARSITIVPASATGCTFGGGLGRRGIGGGFGGGPGGAAPGGAPGGGPPGD